MEAAQNIIKSCRNRAIFEQTVHKQLKRVRVGNTNHEDKEDRKRQSKVDDKQLKAIIETDLLQTTREVSGGLKVA